MKLIKQIPFILLTLTIMACEPMVQNDRIIYPVHRLEEVNQNMERFLKEDSSSLCSCYVFFEATALLSKTMNDILKAAGGFDRTGELNNALDLKRGNDVILASSFQRKLIEIKTGFDKCIKSGGGQKCVESLENAKKWLDIFSEFLSESELQKASVAEIYYWLAVTKNQLLFLANTNRQ